MTRISELCERDVVVGSEEMTVAEAAELMRKRHVGSIVVAERPAGGLGKPKGIVTDRDIVVAIVATGLDPRVMTVGDIMADEVETVEADAAPQDALRLMRTKGVRRLPVVTQAGHLIGLVAFDDLLEVLADGMSDFTRTVGREQSREAAARR